MSTYLHYLRKAAARSTHNRTHLTDASTHGATRWNALRYSILLCMNPQSEGAVLDSLHVSAQLPQ